MWLKQTFTEADKNGDGSLSISEVLQLLHKLNVNLPRQKVKQMFKVPKPGHCLCFIETRCRWLGWKCNDAKLKLVWKGVWSFSCCWNILILPIYSLILHNACEPKCSCSDKSIIFDTIVQHHLFMQGFLNKMSGIPTALHLTGGFFESLPGECATTAVTHMVLLGYRWSVL